MSMLGYFYEEDKRFETKEFNYIFQKGYIQIGPEKVLDHYQIMIYCKDWNWFVGDLIALKASICIWIKVIRNAQRRIREKL